MGGTNDISRNETKNCINALKSTLSALTSTKVVVKEIRKAHINKVCKRLKHVEVLDINKISRACHTRYGQHLNKIGK
jgi:ribosomal protein L4